MPEQTIFPDNLLAALNTAQRVVALTGAGVSAESGVPTFRDAQTGLWAQYDPEDLATPQAFQRNPRLVWEWYAWRRDLVAQAAPNPGHYALAQIEQRVPNFTLITQNVDGLHQRAGSRNVIELHGNIGRVICSAERTEVTNWDANPLPPRCPNCGAYVRSDVVWFGEILPEAALIAAVNASRACDLFLSIGTSGLVQPAASLPYLALDQGATVVVINLDVTTNARPPRFLINGRSGELLPALVQAAWPAEYAT